jgi:1,4-dihydroxy-2-naphthoate octaprenyltransferase
MIAKLVRALRLPFITASALPFIAGSLIAREHFSLLRFLLGFIAAVYMHLSANLINDYADSKSGVDWQDRRFYGFFGGSKLIQEKLLPENFYRNAAILFALVSAFLVFLLALVIKSFAIFGYFACILLLAWSYSTKPLQLSYHRLGEVIIFILFGPALVMGGYFIQTGLFPTLQGFCLSLPVGFLVTAILFANEIPDFIEDKAAGKHTLVGLLGNQKSYLFYCLLVSLAFFTLLLNIVLGYLSAWSLIAFFCLVPALKAAQILKRYYQEKNELVRASKLAITTDTLVNLVIIMDLLICQKS